MPIDPDVLAIVVDALDAAGQELEEIDDGDEGFQEAIMPEAIVRIYREHMAMQDVIRRIARAAPPDRKRRLGEMCRSASNVAERAAWLDLPSITIPVMAEVRTQVNDALELVRRRALVDSDVRDALRVGSRMRDA